MTLEEYSRLKAEAAAKGYEICIDTVVPDPHPGLVDRLAERLFPWAFPSAEMEPG